MDNNEAREFWARFDQIKGQRQVKEIVEAAGIEYELIRVQRTRQRLPQLRHAVLLARELGTTVEYLACGMDIAHHRSMLLYEAYVHASDECRRIVELALKIDSRWVKDQTKSLMMV